MTSATPFWVRVMAGWPLPLLRFVGRCFGCLLWVFAHRRRHIVQTNLRLCFPEQSTAERRALVRAVFVTFAQSLLDRAWLWHGPEDLVRRRLQITGDLSWLRSDGAKVLFAPHFVGLDAGWTALTLSVPRLFATIYARQKRSSLDAWVANGRSRFGAPTLLNKQDAGRPTARTMRAGAALYVLPDMDLGARDAVFVPFFGVPAATVTSLSRFATIGRCAVATVVTRLTPYGYEVSIEPSWEGFPSDDAVADARRMNRVLEALVRSVPAQYHWTHKRFKTRPEGEASVY